MRAGIAATSGAMRHAVVHCNSPCCGLGDGGMADYDAADLSSFGAICMS